MSFCVEPDELKRAGAVERRVEGEKKVPDFYSLFAESGLRVASTGGIVEFEKIDRVISGTSPDTRKPHWYVAELEYSERTLMEKKKNWERNIL